MSDVIIHKKNEVYIKLECEPHILYELQVHFTFEVPGAKFMPQMRNRHWDGTIRLLSVHTGEIYAGLLDKVIDKLKLYNYTYEFRENKFYGLPFEVNEEISHEGVKDYMHSICTHKPRSYQIEGVYSALRYNRKLLISPTASGKSLMIYSLVRYYVDKGQKILLVVPTTSLVEQMYKDFQDYGWDAESYCHKIYSGKERTTKSPVVITTWQSIYKLEKSWFEDFNVVIGDEAHLFKSKSLIKIMSNLHHAKYRFGFTGTLDGTQTHKWVLEGVFGPSYKITRTVELMKQGHVSKLDINCIVLKHPPQRFNVFEDEIQYIIGHEKRNNFIKNLALDLKGNTLILFSRIEAHGEPLFNLINSNKNENQKVFFVHGGVNTELEKLLREKIMPL
jgi:superfamily II DNA or RNA helicase